MKFKRHRRRVGSPVRRRPPAIDRPGMWGHVEAFLEWMRARHFSETTLVSHQSAVRRFLKWCDERSLVEPIEVTQPVVERYQRWLYYHRKENGRPLSVTFQNSLLRSVRAFFRWMTRQHLALFNPAAEIELGRPCQFVPRDVLTAEEAERVLQQPDVTTPVGIRDRALLETLYSTGIRRREVACLELHDIDPAQGTLLVRQGKRRRDRLLPIGRRALAWIDTYQTQVRPRFVADPDELHLFVTETGHPFVAAEGTSATPLSYLSVIARSHMLAAQITKPGGCHIFRHTMASLMLENGADLRYVQEMLGHSNPASTERYTHVSIRKLQQIHQATHPAEHGASPPAGPPTPAAFPGTLANALEQDATDEDRGTDHPHRTGEE